MESVGNGGAPGVLLTDLCKASGCLHHGILIAKFDGNGFDIKSTKQNRKQRVKVGNSYSSWK